MDTTDLPDGWKAIHHSDFLGDVTLIPPGWEPPAGETISDEGWLKVPFSVFAGVVAGAIRARRIADAENMEDAEILDLPALGHGEP
jgi:hypothetical protein